MANEITRDAQATATLMAMQMVEEARAAAVCLPLTKQDTIDGPSLVKQYSKHPVTSDAAAITDGTAVSNTGINVTAATVTAGGVGLKGLVTDFSSKGSLLTVEESLRNFMRATINKIEVDCSAEYSNASTSVGTSGSDMTLANALSAIYNLENGNENEFPAFVLHPIQLSDLRTALTQASGAVFGNPSEVSSSILSSGGSKLVKGGLFGIPVFVSTTCPTANSGADRSGALLNQERATVFAWKWGLTMEQSREVEYPGDAISVHACYGLAELNDAAYINIVTDA